MAEDYGVDNIVDFSKEEVRLSLAQTGDAWAQFMCGFAADSEGDYEKAVDWYEKAATNENQRSLGVHDAQIRLGTMYFKGEGVPNDMGKAYAWYKKAWNEEGFPLILTLRGHQIPLVPGEVIYKGHVAQGSGDFTTEYGRVCSNHGGARWDIPRLFTLNNEGSVIWVTTYKSGRKVKTPHGESIVMSKAKSVDFGGCVGVISAYKESLMEKSLLLSGLKTKK